MVPLAILCLVLLAWIVYLTYLLFQLKNHYTSLIHDSSGKNLQQILEEIVKQEEETKKMLASLSHRYDKIEEEERVALKKIGLTRFNPFKDTGGDQSFILSILNQEDTGIVISGLYSRLGTRWYAKKVEKGQGVDHELSDEEKKAVAAAQRA